MYDKRQAIGHQIGVIDEKIERSEQIAKDNLYFFYGNILMSIKLVSPDQESYASEVEAFKQSLLQLLLTERGNLETELNKLNESED